MNRRGRACLLLLALAGGPAGGAAAAAPEGEVPAREAPLILGDEDAEPAGPLILGDEDAEPAEPLILGDEDAEPAGPLILGDEDAEPAGPLILGEEDADTPERAEDASATSEAGPLRLAAEAAVGVLADLSADPEDARTLESLLDARLALAQRVSRRLGVTLEGRLWGRWAAAPFLEGPTEPHTFAEAELGEAALEVYLPRLDLRVGNLAFAWGANPIVAPADVLSPLDLRFGPGDALLGGTGIRRAVPAAEVAFFAGPVTLRGVVVPVFVPDEAWVTGWDWGLAALSPVPLPQPRTLGLDPTTVDQLQPVLLHTRLPESLPKNLQVAGRLETRLGRTDLALTAFRGWDRAPQVTLDPDLARVLAAVALGEVPPGDAVAGVGAAVVNGDPLYLAEQDRTTRLAAEAVVPLGRLSLRLDAGGSPARTLYTTSSSPEGAPLLGSTALPVLQGAVGLEYLELRGRVLGVTAWALAALEAPEEGTLLFLEEDRVLHGLLGYARWPAWQERLELRLAASVNTSLGGWFVSPAVVWRTSDHLRFTLSAELLGGPAGSIWGAFGQNDAVALTATASL